MKNFSQFLNVCSKFLWSLFHFTIVKNDTKRKLMENILMQRGMAWESVSRGQGYANLSLFSSQEFFN